MPTDCTHTDEVVIALAREVRESVTREEQEFLTTVLYFRENVQIGVTMHLDPIHAIQLAAPVCAAAWKADVVYVTCDTYAIQVDSSTVDIEELERWVKEKDLATRWAEGDRSRITNAIFVQRITRDGHKMSASMPYTIVDHETLWHYDTAIRGAETQNEFVDLVNRVYSEEAQRAWDLTMADFEVHAPSKDSNEREARELACPLMILGSMGVMQGCSLTGVDNELMRTASAMLEEGVSIYNTSIVNE
jgi:hypothetical protein